LREVRVGMSEATVGALLGPPESEWTPEDHPGTWLEDTSKVWGYGTASPHGYASRGSVYFGHDGRVVRL